MLQAPSLSFLPPQMYALLWYPTQVCPQRWQGMFSSSSEGGIKVHRRDTTVLQKWNITLISNLAYNLFQCIFFQYELHSTPKLLYHSILQILDLYIIIWGSLITCVKDMNVHGSGCFIIFSRAVASKTVDFVTDSNSSMIDTTGSALQVDSPSLHLPKLK